jgi:hypothetical protein
MVILWLCAEISVRPRATKLWFAALWICSFCFLLLKETGAVFFGLCVLGLMIQSWRRHHSWKPVASILAGAAVAAICSFDVMAMLCGGVSAALETVRHSAQAAPGNVYGLTYQTGPWYSFPLGLWVLSPLTAIGCAIALSALLLPGKKLANALSITAEQRDILLGLAVLIILVIVAATLPPAHKNLRYISFIFGPLDLIAAVGLTYALTRLRDILSRRAALSANPCAIGAMGAMGAMGASILLLYSCWSDYSLYRDICIRHPLLDLNIRQLVGSRFAHSATGRPPESPLVNLDLRNQLQDKASQ